MKKLLLLFLVVTLVVACSSNDDPAPVDPTDDTSITDDQSDDSGSEDDDSGDSNGDSDDSDSGIPPADFGLETSEVYFDYIHLVWERQADAEELGISYTIFVNSEEVTTDLTEPFYELTELDSNTSFSIIIEARNTVGSSSLELELSTLDPGDYSLFLLKEIKRANSNVILRSIQYNSNHLLSNLKGVNNQGEFEYVTEYDSSGRIIFEEGEVYDDDDFCYFGPRTTISYQGDEITEVINKTDWSCFLEFTKYEFYDINDLPYQVLFEAHGAGVTTINGEVDVVFDAEGRIVSRTMRDLDTLEERTTEFTYALGNLVKIRLYDGNFYEITYDTKPSMYTYSLFREPDIKFGYDFTGFPSAPDPIVSLLFRTPELIGFKNANNITGYFRNGLQIADFQYEYSDFEYPDEVRYENLENGANYTNRLTYWPIE